MRCKGASANKHAHRVTCRQHRHTCHYSWCIFSFWWPNIIISLLSWNELGRRFCTWHVIVHPEILQRCRKISLQKGNEDLILSVIWTQFTCLVLYYTKSLLCSHPNITVFWQSSFIQTKSYKNLFYVRIWIISDLLASVIEQKILYSIVCWEGRE